jgi:hypothetical protein
MEKIDENKSLLVQLELLKERVRVTSGDSVPPEATAQVRELQEELYIYKEQNRTLTEKLLARDQEI